MRVQVPVLFGLKAPGGLFDCRDSSLNGVYYHGKSDKQFSTSYCIMWGKICPAKRAEMKIRPVGF